MGNNATSTEVPASPPAMREVRKGVCRSVMVVVVVLVIERRLSLLLLTFSLEVDAMMNGVSADGNSPRG